MRRQAALAIPLLLVSAAATAQISFPGNPLPTGSTQQAPTFTPAQLPSTDTFSGSAMVDKPVPGTVQLSILNAIDRGLKHNLGLLLSQEQNESARAQYRRSLS